MTQASLSSIGNRLFVCGSEAVPGSLMFLLPHTERRAGEPEWDPEDEEKKTLTSGAGPVGAPPKDEWDCQACTFANAGVVTTASKCTVCGSTIAPHLVKQCEDARARRAEVKAPSKTPIVVRCPDMPSPLYGVSGS